MWDENKGSIPVGGFPNSFASAFGSGQGAGMSSNGTLYRQVSAGLNPGIINQDNVLAVYQLPAKCLDVAGRGLWLSAMGSFANNTNSKTVKIIFNPATAVVGQPVSGGVTIASIGPYTTALAAAWSMEAAVFKYGAAGSNTQIGLHQQAQIAAAIQALAVPTPLTANEAAAILIAITGNAVTALTDIALNMFLVEAQN